MLDQPFVGGAQQVGEFEIVILERYLVEVLDKVDQRVVVQRVLADLAVEVDRSLQHIFQGIDIAVFQFLQRLVEHGANVFLGVLECWLALAVVVDPLLVPARAGRHKEIFA